MKGARSIMLLLIAVALLAAPAAWGQGENPPASTKKGGGSVEQQIKALHEQSRQAALKGDVSFLEKYLSDDYVGIAPDGSIETKDQSIQMRKSGAIKYSQSPHICNSLTLSLFRPPHPKHREALRPLPLKA
jgi:hypothetical protein